MPIYEYFCPDCNTVYSFFSSTVRPDARPDCPKCRRPRLERRPSRFAALRKSSSSAEGDEPGDELMPGVDDAKLEGALDALSGEMDALGEGGEEDPRQLARLFRRFGELSGLETGPKMEEMIRQLEAGADPESLDEDFGGEDGDESGGFEDFFQAKKKLMAARKSRPKVDETLYFL